MCALLKNGNSSLTQQRLTYFADSGDASPHPNRRLPSSAPLLPNSAPPLPGPELSRPKQPLATPEHLWGKDWMVPEPEGDGKVVAGGGGDNAVDEPDWDARNDH